MNAIITDRESKFNPNDRKDNGRLYEFAVIAAMPDYKIENPVICRIYGTASHKRIYACLWTYDRRNGNYVSRSGSGWAGGYGYHRPSAAAAEAEASEEAAEAVAEEAPAVEEAPVEEAPAAEAEAPAEEA